MGRRPDPLKIPQFGEFWFSVFGGDLGFVANL